MSRDEIREQLAQILHEVADVEPDEVIDEKLLEEMGVDSLALFEVSLAVEDRFGVSIPDEELLALQTVGDVLELVRTQTT